MSKIYDKLKELDNKTINNADLEEIELIGKNERNESNKLLSKSAFITILILSVILGFFGAKYFISKKSNIIKSISISDDLSKTISINKTQSDTTTAVSNITIKNVYFDKSNKKIDKIIDTIKSLQTKSSIQLNNLAIIYLEKENFQDALYYAEQALLREPNNPFYWNTIGIVLTYLSLFDDAEKCFIKAISLSSNEGVFYYNLANLYERKGDIVKARENYLLYLSKGDNINTQYITLVKEKLKQGW